jgi:hypothetical protein
MDHFRSPLARQPLAVFIVGIILAFSSNAGSSGEIPSAENCQRLEVLATQYSGVELTGEQKQLKRKMVAWYSGHCVRHAHR